MQPGIAEGTDYMGGENSRITAILNQLMGGDPDAPQVQPGRVYVPNTKPNVYYTPGADEPISYSRNTMSVAAAEAAYYDLDPAQQLEWRKLTSIANGRDSLSTVSQGASQWATEVRAAALYGQQTGVTRDVFQFMQEKVQTDLDQGYGMGGGGGGPKNSTTRRVDMSSPSGARALLDATMASQLGRQPTKKEYKAFYKALTAAQEENPTVTDVRYNADGTSVDQQIVDGLDVGQFTKEYGMAQEDYMDTQVTNRAGRALLQMLGG